MLKTEMRNPKTTHIDKMSPLEIAKVMNEENAYCVQAVEAELPQVALAIDAIAESLQKGGRLFYVGAGTSGRLASWMRQSVRPPLVFPMIWSSA